MRVIDEIAGKEYMHHNVRSFDEISNTWFVRVAHAELQEHTLTKKRGIEYC